MTGGNVRLFLAIQIPEVLRAALAEWQQQNAAFGVRMTPPKNLHVTVAFFGTVTSDAIPPLTKALEAACAAHHQFTLTVDGITPFPQKHSSMWWALCAPSEAFTMFAEDIKNAAVVFAPECDRKPPIPHITLARFNVPPPGALELQECASYHIPVTYGDLMESHLSQSGPRFTLRSRLALQPH